LTKLDWSKGYTFDPARVRSVEDFSHPDRPKEVVITLTRGERVKRERAYLLGVAKSQQKAERKKAELAAKRLKHQDQNKKKAAPALSADEMEANTVSRRLSRLEKSRERFPAKRAKQKAAVIKSHFEAWVESQPGLTLDRTTLRQRWRAKLLEDTALSATDPGATNDGSSA
jgi:hypothetical protein